MLERIPLEFDVDVLVIGAGLAGVCAAVQAARLGCITAIAEKSLVLGGNSGPNGGVHPSGAHRFHPFAAETGIIEEITEEAAWRKAKTDTSSKHYNTSQMWDNILYDKLVEAGVLVLRCHYARKPVMEGKRIVSVIVEDTETYHTRKINVRGSVIESSGDGHIAALAGAGFSMGRDAQDMYNERLAPAGSDSITMGSSVVGLIRRACHPVEFIPPEGTPPFYPGYGGYPFWYHPDDDSCDIFIPTETGGQLNTIEDAHEIYDKALKQIYSAWNYIKNEKYAEESKNWELVWISPQLSKRESRRFFGGYILNENDVESGRIFDDAIGYGGFAFDIHYPRPEKDDYVKIKYYAIPPVYTIPYRSIYSRDVDNLFRASRLLSSSHIAHGTVRWQRTLSTAGQADGAAASLCKKYACDPADIYPNHITELRQLLLREDATIPGCVNEDPKDKARSAVISATSESLFESSEFDSWACLDFVRGIMLWDWPERLDTISFRFRNDSDHPVKVSAVLKHYKPVRPYKTPTENVKFPYREIPNEFEWGGDDSVNLFEQECMAESEVPPGENWVGFEFGTTLSSKDPCSDEERYIVEVLPANDVKIACDRNYYDFVRRIELSEGSGIYRTFPESHMFRLSPRPAYGEAVNVVNGVSRKIGRAHV